jgi:ATP-dependent Lon protease
VLLPARNRKDFEDIPESARDELELVWLEQVDDVMAEALGEPATRREPVETV